MEGTTKLRIHRQPARFGDRGITITRRSVMHVQWIYRQMRKDGLSPADARMSLCFAIATGQRDLRTQIENTLRSTG